MRGCIFAVRGLRIGSLAARDQLALRGDPKESGAEITRITRSTRRWLRDADVEPFATVVLAFVPASAYVAAPITHFISFEVGNLIEGL
jgi:hypothetical protein